MSIIESVILVGGIVLIKKNGKIKKFSSPQARIEQFLLWKDFVIVRENYMESVGPEIYALDSELNIRWRADILDGEDCYANEMRFNGEDRISVSSFKGWILEIELSSGKTSRKGWTK